MSNPFSRLTLLPLLVSGLMFLQSCDADHFISDPVYRRKVEDQFARREQMAVHRAEKLFGVFDHDLTLQEEEALKFLFAYSSLSDLADYNGEFFLANVRSSFAARDTFSWGRTIPEPIFRHFVLPVRINNENLDSSRQVFFAELKDRIKGLPMKQAVLEINHWCHEKVTYRGTDGRTSSPLATVKTAFGRCGEESTFTVAALRAAAIPARQCYTPRWAHCDDNHAWVEVWVDGKWHFIGACEPDADLDLAWFTKPAKRAMLVNTTVFGDYDGPEDILVKDSLFTRINVLENYAPTRKICAVVTDDKGDPLPGASVEFQLYNYAEFYPLHKTTTDSAGRCFFRTGLGDLLVWAAAREKFGFAPIDVRKSDTVRVVLDRDEGSHFTLDLDMVPPAEGVDTTVISDSAKNLNSERLAFEDGLRKSYESTFIDSAKSARFARLTGLDADTLWDLLHRSRGNWRELTSFITSVPEARRWMIFPLLRSVSEKDLRDADTAVLYDHLLHWDRFTPLGAETDVVRDYILSPRVDNEFLRPWRSYFQQAFPSAFADSVRKDPASASAWIRKHVVKHLTANYGRAPLTPAGVHRLRVTDPHSADICFVAMCRSFGVPARLDPATRIPQCRMGGQWKDFPVFDEQEAVAPRGKVKLTSAPSNVKKPEYSTHFTLQTLKEGFFRTLDYEGSREVATFPCTPEAPAGSCLLVTGTRLPDGTILARLTTFPVPAGGTAEQEVLLRVNTMPASDFGRLDVNFPGRIPGEPCILAWIDPGGEPSRHLLADLRQNKQEFAAWKGAIVLVLPDRTKLNAFMAGEAKQLSGNTKSFSLQDFPFGPRDLKLTRPVPFQLPVVLFIRGDGTVRYISEGYRIGITGELAPWMQSR